MRLGSAGTRRAALALVLASVLCLWRLWTGEGIVYSPNSDTIVEHASYRVLLQHSIREEGRLPLWNPSMNGGAPALASPLTMYLFPLEWLYLALPLDRATNLIYALNVLLAGLAMLVLCREKMEHPVSALVCALGYMLSYRYLVLIDAGWLPRMSMYALAPLVFWALERLLLRGTLGRAAGFAGLLGLSLVQCDLQQLYYVGLAAGACAAWHLQRTRPRREVPGRLAWLLAASGLGILLGTPALLPRLEFVALSTRTEPSYAFFLYRPITLSTLAQLIDPMDAGGHRVEYWENVLYMGLWLYPLVLYGLLCQPRRSVLLAVAGLVPLVLVLDTPLLRLLYEHLPGFSMFRIPGRMLFLTQIAWLLVAGRGIDRVLRVVPRRWSAVLAALLCLQPLLDAGVRVLPRLETRPLAEAFPQHAFQEPLQRSASSGRTAVIGRRALPYGMAATYGIDLINGYSSLNLKHYMDYFLLLKHGDPAQIPPGPKVFSDLNQIARPDLLAALDVHFLVANEAYPIEELGFEKLADYKDVPVMEQYRGIVRVPIHVWQAQAPLGAAYLATSVHPVADEAASLQAVAHAASVRQAFVWDLQGRGEWLQAQGSARMLKRGINEYEYEVDSDGRGFLILSQVWFPGWQATLDGERVELYRTNHALLGCFVPAGRHRLRLVHSSPAFERGLALCGAGLAALLAAAVLRTSWPWRASSRSRRPSASGTAP